MGRLTWVAWAGILRSELGKVRMVTGGLLMDESMDTPVDKTQLLGWITVYRAELDAVIAPLTDAQMTAPRR